MKNHNVEMKDVAKELSGPPKFEDKLEERVFLKRRLVAALRCFTSKGFELGVAGHITVRDPVERHSFWVNPMGVPFAGVAVADLLRVGHGGERIEGTGALNGAAFAIHASLHRARPGVIAAAHAHSSNGQAFSTLVRPLRPLTQDGCAFFEDHIVYDEFTGVVVDLDEGERIAKALARRKMGILRNHGLLTVGRSIEEAVYWFALAEHCCGLELSLGARGDVHTIDPDVARSTGRVLGSSRAGWINGNHMLAEFDVK